MQRRAEIRMSPDEIRGFLASRKTIVLTSNGPRGHPHPMPMWFVVDAEGAVCMTTYRKSQKVRNIERDPRVSLLVESGEVYAELKGVAIEGRAELLEDLDSVAETMLAAAGHGAGEVAAATRSAAEPALRRQAAKRVVIRVVPERIVSWDHAKLGAAG